MVGFVEINIPISSEAAQGHADDERRRPFDALRPIALDSLLEVSLAQTQQVGPNGAVGSVE